MSEPHKDKQYITERRADCRRHKDTEERESNSGRIKEDEQRK